MDLAIQNKVFRFKKEIVKTCAHLFCGKIFCFKNIYDEQFSLVMFVKVCS